MENLKEYCLGVARRAKAASAKLAAVRGETKNAWLHLTADKLLARKDEIVAENEKDLADAEKNGLSPAMIDRLRLNEKTLSTMAAALREIAMFPDPIGKIIASNVRPNGLEVRKVRVPLGVVFFIYESRPNVTTDAAAICIKSGNAVILRGGKEAIRSNLILAKVIAEAAAEVNLPEDAVQVLNTTDRAAIDEFLAMPEYIDLTIPRGGAQLIRRVADGAKMPVIKHFAGNCHVYVDAAADPDVAEKVVINSKCQRLGTCNTAESLVVHSFLAPTLLPRLVKALAAQGVEVRGDVKTCSLCPEAVPASDEDYFTEYLAKIISVKVVDSIDEAIAHINRHSSSHTESIVTRDIDAAKKFTTEIDSSAVMVNASTRLNDGGIFGLGAEIGISTDKFHARGPCGINELTSYKYLITGDGQVR